MLKQKLNTSEVRADQVANTKLQTLKLGLDVHADTIVVVLSNGMVLMGVPPSVQIGVQGLMIIAAVALSIDRKLMRIVK